MSAKPSSAKLLAAKPKPANRLSVCIFSKAMAAHRDGRFLWPFSLVSRQLVEQGHEVTVITTAHPDGRTRLAREHGAEVHYLGGTLPEKTDKAFWRESGKCFDELHQTRHFDVVLGRGRSPYGYLAHSRYAKTLPLVSHEGTFPAWLHGYELANRLFSRQRERLHALLYAAANRIHASCLMASRLIVCNSPALAGSIGRAFWWRDVHAGCIPYGFSPEEFLSGSEGADPGPKVRQLLCSDRRFIVYVGRVTRNKGALDLLRVLHGLQQKDVCLLIVGRANSANIRRVERLAAGYGLGERVILAGAVSHAALPLILNRAEAMLFPSVHPESLPKVVMEAMACSLPVVAYRLPAFRGLIDHGVEGLLAQPGNTAEITLYLDNLLADDAARRKMGEAERARIESSFDPERVAGLWGQVLSDIVREAREKRSASEPAAAGPAALSYEPGAG